MRPLHRASRALLHALSTLAAAGGTSSGLLRAAPLPGSGRRAGPSSRLRRTLVLSTAEGTFTELVNACAGPTILTGWAIHLHATPLEIGLIGALAYLTQVVQLPAAWVTATFGRRRVAIAAVTIQRLGLFPLALLAWVPFGPGVARAFLLGVAALSTVLGVLANNAWTAWLGDVVPAQLRGRYFGRRTAVCILGGTGAGLVTGRLLDHAAGAHAVGATLAWLAVAASVFGAVTTFLMSGQHDVPIAPGPAPDLRAALRPLADPEARPLLRFQLWWNAAVGVGGGFFAFHLLSNLHAGFTILALHAAVGALSRTLAAPLWGRTLDRLGARPVLAACSFALAALPLVWLVPREGFVWPIFFDALVGGIAWGGHQLASFALPLAVAPRRDRPFYLAAFAMVGGLAYAAATAAGGVLAGMTPARFTVLGHAAYAVEPLFVLSALGRLGSAFLALRIPEPGAGTLGALHRLARRRAAAVVEGAFEITRVRVGSGPR